MIRLIRSFLCCICFTLFGIGGLGLGLLVFPIILIFFRGTHQRRILCNSIHITWRFFVWLLTFSRLISVRCDQDNLLRNLHGHIVIANHPSLIDVVIVVSKIPNSVCVVKDNLFHNFFIRHVIRRIYLSNNMSPDEFLTRGTEYLKSGHNLVIFPEGTRTRPNHSIHFHRGFAYLHLHSGAPILPIMIHNTPPILGKGQPWYDIGRQTSNYTLTPLSVIQHTPSADRSDRQIAHDITAQAKSALFPAQDA